MSLTNYKLWLQSYLISTYAKREHLSVSMRGRKKKAQHGSLDMNMTKAIQDQIITNDRFHLSLLRPTAMFSCAHQ